MSFTWTYLIVGAISLLGVAVAWFGVGPLGVIAHVYAIILFSIGGLLIFLSRTGRWPLQGAEGRDERFTGYPRHQVMGVFDSRSGADEAVRHFRDAGYGVEDISVFSGEKGEARLDSEGDSHGVAQVADRSIEHLMSDIDDLKTYEAAVHRGAVVVGVQAPDEGDREVVAAIFRRHGGHDLYYFGALAVEQLDADPERVTADEGLPEERAARYES